MKEKDLTAHKREISTKGAVNALRRAKTVPGVYYAKGQDPVAIQVEENAINTFVFTPETHIIKLDLDGEKDIRCILKDIQYHPITDRVIHFDLQGLHAGEQIELEIPVVVSGQAKGVREEGGILQQNLHRLDILCFPNEIPEEISVNVADLAIGDSILVKDLKLGNIKIVTAPDTAIVNVVAHKEAEETEATEAEPEVIEKAKPAEEK